VVRDLHIQSSSLFVGDSDKPIGMGIRYQLVFLEMELKSLPKYIKVYIKFLEMKYIYISKVY
jgi:hypothetical protein